VSSRRRRSAAYCVAVLLCNAVQALASEAAQQGVTEGVGRGRAQFLKSCAFCHGPDATGTTEGPSLIRSDLMRHDENGNLIAPVIRDGRPTKGMPPIPISEAQVQEIVAFLHWRLTDADRTNPADPRDYGLDRLLTGDAAAGKAFFFGAGGCSHCHSSTGDLAGIAKRDPPADLEARFLYPPDIWKAVTVTTASGDKLFGDLTFQDDFSIAIKDHEGWYHSWPVNEIKFEIHDPLAVHLELLHRYTNSDIHNVFAYLETLK